MTQDEAFQIALTARNSLPILYFDKPSKEMQETIEEFLSKVDLLLNMLWGYKFTDAPTLPNACALYYTALKPLATTLCAEVSKNISRYPTMAASIEDIRNFQNLEDFLNLPSY